MIKLDNKTRQDFLDRSWVKKLEDAGILMDDAKYCIVSIDGQDYVKLKDEISDEDYIPTYSFAELLYKLNEWPSIQVGEDKFIGTPLTFFKDAPFYGFGYYFSKDEIGTSRTYNMSFEEAQEYIEKRGFDIPWNDCDVNIESDKITQTIGNVLKWADKNPPKRKEYRKYDMETVFEHPIYAAAELLIKSARSEFYNFKYVKDISNK